MSGLPIKEARRFDVDNSIFLTPVSLSAYMWEHALHSGEDENGFGDYCENCHRPHVYKCVNGKHRCDKCDWCPENHAVTKDSEE